MRWRFGLLALVFCVPYTSAVASDSVHQANVVAQVKVVTGTASLVRAAATVSLAGGEDLLVGDTLRTGEKSALGLTFRDGTTLSLGAGSDLTVDSFLFEPAADKLSLVADLHKGTLALVTGEVAKLSPESMAVRTPVATMSVRGTSFLVKVDD